MDRARSSRIVPLFFWQRAAAGRHASYPPGVGIRPSTSGVAATMRDHELSADLEKFIGRVVRGKWRIDELLGSGSMSHVFAATHRNGTRAAIKLLRSDLAKHPEVCARYLSEGYLANAVAHPDAVRVLDDDVEGDDVFLVMDLLE